MVLFLICILRILSFQSLLLFILMARLWISRTKMNLFNIIPSRFNRSQRLGRSIFVNLIHYITKMLAFEVSVAGNLIWLLEFFRDVFFWIKILFIWNIWLRKFFITIHLHTAVIRSITPTMIRNMVWNTRFKRRFIILIAAFIPHLFVLFLNRNIRSNLTSTIRNLVWIMFF